MSSERFNWCDFHAAPSAVCACNADVPSFIKAEEPAVSESNPKTLMGRLKVPVMSVMSPASMICEAMALQYGAYEAPRKDDGKGYGPYNWREQDVEAMIYIDATMRHLAAWVDGEDRTTDSLLPHLWHAKASLGILIDAIENETCIDDRPKIRKQAASRLLEKGKTELIQRACLPAEFQFND